jgi:hypothetical protein
MTIDLGWIQASQESHLGLSVAIIYRFDAYRFDARCRYEPLEKPWAVRWYKGSFDCVAARFTSVNFAQDDTS